MHRVIISLAFVLFSALFIRATAAYAASPYPKANTGITEAQLEAIEQKLLQKTYAGDPLSKRLQRLELSLFGATQYGSDSQRWQKIKNSLNNSDSAKNNISASLNELEKYVFKKTTPNVSSSLRLTKLETKLFGKASPSMPVAYRIERLKRTLGIDAGANIAQERNSLPPGMPGVELSPGNPMFGFDNDFNFGGNDMNDPGFNQFESQISQMFRQMEQMQRMQPHGNNQEPGIEEHHFYMYSTPDGGFKWGTGSDPGFEPGLPQTNKDKKFKPDNNRPNGEKNLPPSAPHLIPQPNIPEDHIPSYADPNFI